MASETKSLMDLIKEKAEKQDRKVEALSIDVKKMPEVVVMEKYLPTEEVAKSVLMNVASDFKLALGDKLFALPESESDGKKLPAKYSYQIPGLNEFLSVAGNQINVRVMGTTRTIGKVTGDKTYVLFEDQKEALKLLSDLQHAKTVKA